MGKTYRIGRESGGIVNNSARSHAMSGNSAHVLELWSVSIGDPKPSKV